MDCEYLDEWAPDTRHPGRGGTTAVGGLARLESIASWISHCLLSGEYEQLESIHLLPHYSRIVSVELIFRPVTFRQGATMVHSTSAAHRTPFHFAG